MQLLRYDQFHVAPEQTQPTLAPMYPKPAGFLTYGSTERQPSRLSPVTAQRARALLPKYSDGIAQDSHLFPFYPLSVAEAPISFLYFILNRIPSHRCSMEFVLKAPSAESQQNFSTSVYHNTAARWVFSSRLLLLKREESLLVILPQHCRCVKFYFSPASGLTAAGR